MKIILVGAKCTIDDFCRTALQPENVEYLQRWARAGVIFGHVATLDDLVREIAHGGKVLALVTDDTSERERGLCELAHRTLLASDPSGNVHPAAFLHFVDRVVSGTEPPSATGRFRDCWL